MGPDTTYRVVGMTCGGCAKSLTNALAKHGVPHPEVSFEKGTVNVSLPHDEADVKRAVEAAGFTYVGVQG